MNNIVRGPININFDITNRCNLNCLHCYNSSGEGDFSFELSDNEVLNIVDQIIEMKPYNVCICGGETLIRKRLVLKVLEKLTKANISCGMVTNGILLTEELAKSLKKKGINNIQISLDGKKWAHNNLRNNKNAYDGAIRGLKLLSKYNIISGIAFSPTKWNISEFDSVFSLAEELGVHEVRLQDLMSVGRAEKNLHILPSEKEYRQLKKEYNKKILENLNGKTNVNVAWGDPIDHLLVFTESFSNSSYTDTICILSDGSITPSIYLPKTFGNLRKHTLSEYWIGGLNQIWGSEHIISMVSKLTSVKQMTTPSNNTQSNRSTEFDILN
ncbi:radical SAM protein [Enterococcus faecalis]|nr:radical SAM protein [Enterococcus faecalis]